jgi:hypothetical protein
VSAREPIPGRRPRRPSSGGINRLIPWRQKWLDEMKRQKAADEKKEK